jgi:dTDP-4-dehydrorhamnose 3,5-epimerase
MNVTSTAFNDLNIVEFFRAPDDRGTFIKPWLQSQAEAAFGSSSEIYFSRSHKGVLRGLHFQRGVFAQKKFVICLSGKIEDIAVDLRDASPTKGRTFRITLEGMQNRGVIIPAGFAHGIFAHEDSIITNICDKPYSAGEEGGIFWQSVPDIAELPVTLVSAKDAALPPLEAML